MAQANAYRFSFGPWNISEGADVFGPPVRSPLPLEAKLDLYQPLGFTGVQFHDDDVVENLETVSAAQALKRAEAVKQILKDRGLTAEFVAPRLWMSPQTVDGALTSNSAADRQAALDRCCAAIDLARAVGTRHLVLWLAREGTSVRESKNARLAYEKILDSMNRLLRHDPEIQIWIEPKPNEPCDHAYVPTIGHALALGQISDDPARVMCLIETAHAILAGLDPSDEMAFALAMGKLASVHLNDQNGLKYDQDKSFGAANLRGAFAQVRVLEEAGYGRNGEFIGLDVKALRTQPQHLALRHLSNSRMFFLEMVDRVRSLDRAFEAACIRDRDYEKLEAYILLHLMGVPDAADRADQYEPLLKMELSV